MNRQVAPALFVAIAFTWLLAGSSAWMPAAGKSTPPKSATFTVGLLDLTKVFKNYHKFAERSEAMKKDVDAAEEALKSRRGDYQTQVTKLEGLGAGTDERKKMEEDLKRIAAEIAAEVDVKKRKFLEQEAGIYIESYDEIGAALKGYADEHDIRLVLRFNGDPVKRDDPQEVLKELNKSVLYHSNVDVTNEILALLNGDVDRK